MYNALVSTSSPFVSLYRANDSISAGTCLHSIPAPSVPIINHTGFPLLSHFLKKKPTDQGGFNLGGINSTGQIPKMPGNFGLIDLDTPKDAYTKASYMNPGDEWDLIFSDEFNQDGRSFYPGDDPYWEAVRDLLDRGKTVVDNLAA